MTTKATNGSNIATSAKVVGLALTVGTMLIAIGISWGSNNSEISELKDGHNALEVRQDELTEARRADRELILETRNDVKWIRQVLEQP